MTTTAPATARKPATMAQALTRALRDAMADDPSVHVMGEDVGTLGGVFRVTDGLAKEFGEDRCTDTALAEAGILGTAVGMAMYGLRPVVEMQFDAFAYPAFEQLISHVARMRNRTRGALTMPLTIRVPYGGGSAGSSTTVTPPRRTTSPPRGSRSSPRRPSRTPTDCCAPRSPPTIRSSSSNPSGCTGPRPTGRPTHPPRSRPWAVPRSGAAAAAPR